jgi:hypothetical protein
LGPRNLDRVPADRDVFPSWYLFRDSASPLRFLVLPRRTVSTPQCHHGHLSSTAFPRSMTRWRSQAWGDRFPSSWSSGFSPPRCYQRFIGPESLVLSVNLPPSAPPRFGVSSSSRFAVVAGNRRRQDRRASLGKTHHLPISRPASCQVSAPDIRPRLVTSARPPPQHHLAGSLFATYTGSASCFLPTPHCWRCPCLVGVVLPSGHGGPSCSRRSSGTAACASCQAHMKNPAAS